MKTLVLFTNGFPYNIAEPFLEQEVPLYKDYFDRVLIVTACKRGEAATRIVNECFVEVLCDYTLSKDIFSIIKALPFMLSDRHFYAEIAEQLKKKKLTMRRLYEIIVFSLCGNGLANRAVKWLKQHKDSHCNVFYSYWLHIPAYAAIRANELLGNTRFTISRAHGFDVYLERRPSCYIPFHKSIYKLIDEIAPVSDDGKQYLEHQYGVLGKVTVRHLGAVDQGTLNPISGRETFRIVTCARTIPLKRLDKLVDALAQIVDQKIEWTHIGDGESQSSLEKYAADQLPENVKAIFLGRCSNAQVYETYANNPYHVFVNISESEGAPVSVMEAMSFGIPVIATDVGGTSEIVDGKLNGILLGRDFEIGELVDSLRQLVKEPEEVYSIRRSLARKAFEEKYNAVKNFSEFALYLSTLAKR